MRRRLLMRLRRLRRALFGIDKKIIDFVVKPPGPGAAAAIITLAALLFFGSSFLLYMTRKGLQIDLFFLPIVIVCVFFRIRGLFFFIPAIIGYHLSIASLESSGSSLMLKDGIVLVKWLILAFIVIYAVLKFKDVKKHQDRLNQDVSLAKALQKTLLSKPFDLEKIRIMGFINQCMEVGGDFYFFRPFKKKYVVLAIGDIMGKGIPASLVMAVVMGFFYEWGKKSYSPSFILDKINKRLIDLWGEGSWYSTLFYSVFDEETKELIFSNGGHQRGILQRADGDLVLLEAEGLPIGIFPNYQWEEKRISLSQGDRLILFTDGVSEARNPQGQLYGLERLLDRIAERRSASLEELLDSILRDVKSHSGPNFESDDVALVMFEIKKQTK